MPLASPPTLPWPPVVGDFVPAWVMPTAAGTPANIGDFLGKPLVFAFAPGDPDATAGEYCALAGEFRAAGVGVALVAPTEDAARGLAELAGPNLPVLVDADGSVRRAYCGSATGWVVFALDVSFRVLRMGTGAPGEARDWLNFLRGYLTREEPRHVTAQAPVLLIPDVFPPEFCQELMRVWEVGGNVDSGSMVERDGKTVAVMNYGHKIRRDHFLAPGPVKDQVNRYLGYRVRPEIRKAFHFEVTRFEDFRIVCYDAARGGYFRPHRDNTTTGTAHRVFAMTLNLNAGEYEGGYLRFPEYGPHVYRPRTGEAVIFSCSLLHEATDVTAGRRFVLLSFFYGEAQARLRDELARKAAAAPPGADAGSPNG